MNEQEKFLKELEINPSQVDVLDQPLNPEAPAKEPEVPKIDGGDDADPDGGEPQGDLKPRNRRERRLMERLSQERESSSFLAGKLEARTEAQRAVSEEADYLKSVERIYGTDTPEAQLATDLLKKAIVGAREDAKALAVQEMREERIREVEEERQASAELDAIIEDIEDDHDVTLTDPQKRSFFQLLEKMSPKDKDGNVTDYADPEAVWEVFSEKLQKRTTSDNSQAKNLSSRSMVQSGASKQSNLPDDVAARFLKDNGII